MKLPNRTIKNDDIPFAQLRIARLLRNIRKDAGITQKKLAEKSGVSVSHIQKIERGVRDFSMNTCCKLAEAMGHKFMVQMGKR